MQVQGSPSLMGVGRFNRLIVDWIEVTSTPRGVVLERSTAVLTRRCEGYPNSWVVGVTSALIDYFKRVSRGEVKLCVIQSHLEVGWAGGNPVVRGTWLMVLGVEIVLWWVNWGDLKTPSIPGGLPSVTTGLGGVPGSLHWNIGVSIMMAAAFIGCYGSTLMVMWYEWPDQVCPTHHYSVLIRMHMTVTSPA